MLPRRLFCALIAQNNHHSSKPLTAGVRVRDGFKGGLKFVNIEDLYIKDIDNLHEDLYRMGNATSPSFSEARGLKDCLIVEVDEIKIVKANGNGFSAFNSITATMKRKGKNVWKIKKGAPLEDIRVVKGLRSDHKGRYMLAPEKDMPFKKYLGILEELGFDKAKCVKLTQAEIANG